RLDLDVLEHLEFMRLPSGALLAVLVTRSGQVQNKLIPPSAGQGPLNLGADELDRIHQYVRQQLGGRTLSEVRARIAEELSGERATYDQLQRRALELSQQAI